MTLLELIIALQNAYIDRISGNTTYEQMTWAAKEVVRQWLALN